VISLSSLSFQQMGYSNGLNTIGTRNLIGISYKKDCILSFGGIIIANGYQSLDIQAAIAYHDFLAVQIGYKNSLTLGGFGGSFSEKFSNRFINISVGIFYNTLLQNSKWLRKKEKWNNRFKRRHFLVDAYIAYGKGINKTFQRTLTFTGDLTGNAKILFDKLYLQGGAHYHGNVFGFSLTGLLGMLQFNKVGVYNNFRLVDIANLIETLEEERHYLTSGYTIKASLAFHRFKLVYCAHQDYILGFNNLNDYISNKARQQLKVQVNIYNLFQRK